MTDVGIAVLVMMAATLAVHLGLPQAMAGVVMRVCKCHKCMSFWLVLIVLTVKNVPLVVAGLLSLCAAYVSHWFALLLIWACKVYDRLWEKVK